MPLRFNPLAAVAALALWMLFPVASFAQDGDDLRSAQPEPAKHAVYLEGLGNAGLYSVNYDRRFTPSLSLRGGISVVGATDQQTGQEVSLLIVPVTLNYLAGGPNHSLEMGVGPLFAAGSVDDLETTSDSEISSGLAGVTSTFGYRYQPARGGFVFRAGLIPFYSANEFQLWAGISVGLAF